MPATLTGRYELPDGTPARGTVEITPNSPVILDQNANIVFSGSLKVTLDVQGRFSVVLPATDDTTLEPATGRQYTIRATLYHSGSVPELEGVTLAGGTTSDVSKLTSGVAAAAVYSAFLTKAQYDALVARVGALEAGGGGGGAVASVNGHTGAVVLTKGDVGLSNVDNTADASKPAAAAQAAADTAVQTAAASDATGKVAAHAADHANPHAVTKAQVGLGNVDNTADSGKPVSTAQAAINAAKADLVGGTIPASQLPSYVDDVLEFANLAAFPATGESGKIYTALDTNKIYRWSGSAYIVISDTIALGTTSSSAYRGDLGTANASNIATNTTAISNETTRAQAAEALAAQKANNLSDLASVATARTNLGLGTAATQNKVAAGSAGVLDATDASTTNSRTPTAHAASHAPGAADDLTTALSATSPPVALGTAAVGAGTGFARQGHVHPTTGLALTANNLSDLASAATARTNLGLGTAATVNTGTASGNVPLLSTGGVLPIARLATGTPDGTKFVRDDGTLVTPSGGVSAAAVRASLMTQMQAPTGALGVTMPRYSITSTLSWLSTGRLYLFSISLLAGDTITSVSFSTGTTAGATLTHRWAALYSSSLSLIRQSADDTSASWAASTVQVYTLTSTYTVPTSGVYYIGLMVAGTTMPTLVGNPNPQGVANGVPPFTTVGADSGLTTTAPATATPGGPGAAGAIWGWVS